MSTARIYLDTQDCNHSLHPHLAMASAHFPYYQYESFCTNNSIPMAAPSTPGLLNSGQYAMWWGVGSSASFVEAYYWTSDSNYYGRKRFFWNSDYLTTSPPHHGAKALYWWVNSNWMGVEVGYSASYTGIWDPLWRRNVFTTPYYHHDFLDDPRRD